MLLSMASSRVGHDLATEQPPSAFLRSRLQGGVGQASLTSPEPSDGNLGSQPGCGPTSLWSRGLEKPGSDKHTGAH